MNTDLIFHVASRRKWPNLNKDGVYKPEDYSKEEGIECVTAEILQEYLNEQFSGRKNLLLLVIDVNRLVSKPVKTDKKEVYRIHGPINTDSILDKIRIDCNKNKEFDLSVKSS